MKTGLSTYSLQDTYFLIQLDSLLQNGIRPDFILLHEVGLNHRPGKYLRFLKKTIRQQRIHSLSHLLSRKQTQPDGGHLKPDEAAAQKREAFLSEAIIYKTGPVNGVAAISLIRSLSPAVIVSNSGILKAEVLASPDIIFLNVHASRLPEYRGMNNIEWALWDQKEIWVSIHRISREIDEGDILWQEKISTDNVSLPDIEAYRSYVFRQSHLLTGKILKKYLNAEIAFVPQLHKGEPLLQYYTMHPLLKARLEARLQKGNS
ncbi:MAG TPA: formyltransferase family protein [Bacteroidia bacterium]|nr:formyltransferase family protein [Bacteroidia bacterium]